ncbi:ImmA/IrrE family metallo-endopeptidase [Bacillus sp. AFS041924]|uniref:ImmA/IrrE family metallo-endopeptidase n=1 Tax=Bacillus sp. AFS041924 TaxID=2033503 RepID=UPI000BFE1081|nr:ImmA/IrrE family metallo-endopeptidase [Bacillus sp. AFS041924]PGS52780.1 hypothetical protein COC46_08445 [Bacillus sp. AFS041924]
MFSRTDKVVISDIDKKKINYEAKIFANEIREKLNVNADERINVIKFLEEQGYLVFQILNLGTSGFIRILGKEKAIFLNASEPLGRQIYTAIHEFCHILKDLSQIKKIDNLSEEQKQYELDKMEYFAFKFADYFLMSEPLIFNYLSKVGVSNFSKITIKEIMNIQHHFQLSFRQTTRMLNKYGVLTDFQRDEFNKLSTKENPILLKEKTVELGFDIDLISPLSESRIPERFNQSILDNIKNGRISRKKVLYLANLLHMPSLEKIIEVGKD